MNALTLVNAAHPLTPGVPPDLVPVDENHPHILLERRAARLLAACIQAGAPSCSRFWGFFFH